MVGSALFAGAMVVVMRVLLVLIAGNVVSGQVSGGGRLVSARYSSPKHFDVTV